MRWSRSEMNLGAIAVDAFFTLSGWLVWGSWQRSPDWISYILRRVLRIYPGFVAVTVLQGFVLVPMLTGDVQVFRSLDVAFGRVLMYALTLGGYGAEAAPSVWPFEGQPYGALNASLWTVHSEFLCYLLVPILSASRLMRWELTRSLVVGMCVLIFAWVPDWEWHDILKGFMGSYWHWQRFLAFFLAGVWLSHSGQRLPKSWSINALLGLGLILSARQPFVFRLALPILGGWLIHNLAYSKPLIALSRRLPGDYSYGIYLYSFPCQQLLVKWTGTHWNPYAFCLASVLLTLIPAVLSWKWIEYPALQLKEHWKTRSCGAPFWRRRDPE